MKIFRLLLVSSLCFLSSCNLLNADIIPVEQSKQAVQQDGALLLDVRSDLEFEQGHLKGAMHIPHTQIQQRIAELQPWKEKGIVLYCKSGHRAGIAAEVLKSNGFLKIQNGGGYTSLREILPCEKC